MGLRFILGRAGAGKTAYCLQEVRNELRERPLGPGIILLVPEQSTFQMEQRLTGTGGIEGSFRAQVYSFRRLAWRVFQETGGARLPFLGDNGKRMLVCRLLEENRHQLKAFARVARQPGFYDRLLQAISELKNYRVGPEVLEEALALWQEESAARDKLEDIVLIYRGFEEAIKGKFLDPDDYLRLCAERLGESPTCVESEVWVDGFKGFTPQEYGVLESLLRAAERVNVLLCLDPEVLGRNLGPEEVFFCTYDTYNRLLETSRRAGVDVEPPVILGGKGIPRFGRNRDLSHLEREWPNWPGAVYSEEANSIKLVAAQDRRAEVEAVAREILRLCRDEGYRFREIAVLVRDLSLYRDAISRVFRVYRIPCFIDARRPVTGHPLTELVRSALDVILSGWGYESVFRFLKTDLSPVSREEVDELENYVLAHGIQGDRWADPQPWSFRRRYLMKEDEGEEKTDFDRINRVRKRAVAELIRFEEQVKHRSTVGKVTRALYGLLEELGVKERLENWSKAAQAEGNLEEAAEHAEVYNQFLALLDEMVQALEDHPLSLEEYLRILEAGLEGLTLGLIPPGLDQVFVGSLERSRPPEVRAVFLMGANDGILPQIPPRDGILGDEERSRLQLLGVELAPGRDGRLLEEQFLIYTGLTRASEGLWVSFSRADEQGRALAPSPVVERIKALFPGLKTEDVFVEPVWGSRDIEYVTVPAKTLSLLASRLRKETESGELDPVWSAVFQWFEKNGPQNLSWILEGLSYRNVEDPLPGEIAEKLYGCPLYLSVSQLEQFISCPFAYFIRYGLRARERETAKIRPADMGTFFHEALKRFVERVGSEGIDWDALGREECQEIAEEIVAEILAAMESEMQPLSERRRYLAGKLQEIVAMSAWAVARHIAGGEFRPVAVELASGSLGIPPLLLDDGEIKLKLVGKIDRIDCAPGQDVVYLRVIDYKSGTAELRLDELYYGLSLQLIAYLDIVLENGRALWGKDPVPAGVFYFEIKNPLIKGDRDSAEEAEQGLLSLFRMKGLVLGEKPVISLMHRDLNGHSYIVPVGIKKDGSLGARSKTASREQFYLLTEHFRRLAREGGKRILSGEVSISPFAKGKRTACDYCGFRAVCRFDPVCGDWYRVWSDLSDAAVWANLMKKHGGESGGDSLVG